MRNLKRALSLTLASVMLLGMMVVGSSAAAGYDDVADTDNVEAIEVLQAIEVMVGDERGFGPERPVNRAEMAVVMGKLLSLDYNYYEATCPFNDVYDWARGWVGACYANGIVSGRGEGVYDPGTTVTAVEAASMLMRALGYFKYQSDYANGFEVSTVSQATKINLFDGVNSKTNEPLTRNQVAQMALNALKSGVVEPDGNALNFIDANGNVIATGGKVNYVYTTSTKAFASAISHTTATSIGSTNDGWIVELGEQLYNGDLQLKDDLDVFQRPARTWEFKGKEVGTYVKKELLKQTYTEKVTGKMLYELLTASTIRDYDYVIAVDGETEQSILGGAYFTPANLIRSNTDKVGATGNGVITEVYVDNLDEIYYISVINTYLAKAAGNYNEKKDEAKFTVWAITDDGRPKEHYVKDTTKKETLTVTTEDFNVAGVKDGDIYLVQVADGDIQVMIDPEVLDNTKINSFKKNDWVVADGTKYIYNNAIKYDDEVLDFYDDFNMKDTAYRVYLDPNGFALGVEIVAEPDQYVFLTGLDKNGSNISNKVADANAIFLDGTMSTIRINMTKSEDDMGNRLSDDSLKNTWCTYTVNSDGTYTLTQVADDADSFVSDRNGAAYTGDKHDKLGQGRNYDETSTTPNEEFLKIDKKNVDLNGILANREFKTVYGNDDSVYLTVGTTELTQTWTTNGQTVRKHAIVIDDVDSVSTGVQDTSVFAWNAAKVLASDSKYSKDIPLTDVANGVYTLFKDNGYVIAAVVVGEDDGTTSHYAFAHTGDLEQEDWTATDAKSEEGIYTWYRKVIMDGQETTLTEKAEDKPELKKMSQGYWFEVKFKADGTVRKVEPLEKSFTSDYTALKAKFIRELPDIEKAVQDYDTVLLWSYTFDRDDDVKSIAYKARTLQIETKEGWKSYGFPVASNANIVLLQDKMRDENINGNIDYYDIVTEYTGADGLEQAVDHLNMNNYFWGEISAVFENGLATSVVIHDRYPTNVNTTDEWNRGVYTINFKRALYNSNYNAIYVDGRELTDTEWAEGSFRANSDDLIEIYKTPLAVLVEDTFEPTGSVWVDAAKTVKGTVSANGRVLTFNPMGSSRIITLSGLTSRITTPVSVSAANAKVFLADGTTPATNSNVYVGDTIVIKADTGYSLKNGDVTGAKLVSGDKYEVTGNVVVEATKDTPIVPGEEITVEIKGTAVRKNHYTVTGLDEDDKIKTGETFTITANKRIAVYEGTTRTEMTKGETKTITASKETAIVINRFAAAFVGDILSEVEKKDDDTPVVPAMASMAAYARNARADMFVKIRLEGQFAPDRTYVVKVVSGGYQFGKDTTEAMRTEIVNALEEADLANTDIEIAVTDDEVDEKEIAAWNGETEPDEPDPAEYETNAVIEDDGDWTVRYMSDDNTQPTNDEIAELIGEKVTVKKVSGSGDARKVLIIPEGETAAEEYNVALIRVVPAWYDGKILSYADLGKVNQFGTFEKDAKICATFDGEEKAFTNDYYGPINGGKRSVDLTASGNNANVQAMYLYDVVGIDLTGADVEIYIAGKADKPSDKLTGVTYVAADETLFVRGAGDAETTAGFRALTAENEDGDAEYVAISEKPYTTDVDYIYGKFDVADLPLNASKAIKLSETLGLYRIEVGDLKPVYYEEDENFEINVPDETVYISGASQKKTVLGEKLFIPEAGQTGNVIRANNASYTTLDKADDPAGTKVDYVIKLNPAYVLTNELAGTGAVATEKVYSNINNGTEITSGSYVAEGIKVYVKAVEPNTILSSGIEGTALEAAMDANDKPILPSQTVEAQYYFEMPAADLTLDGDSFVVEQLLKTDGVGLELKPNAGSKKLADRVTITSVGAEPGVDDITWYFNSKKLTLAEVNKIIGKYFEVEIEPTTNGDEYTFTVTYNEDTPLEETLTYQWVLEVGDLSLKGEVKLNHST